MDVSGLSSSGLLQTQAGLSTLIALNITLNLWPQDKGVKFDTSNNTNQDDFYYDYVIVGAGTSGSIMANQLSEDGRYKVAVIEAGGTPNDASMDPEYVNDLAHTSMDWDFRSTYMPQKADQFECDVYHFTSGKVLGGGSSLGYMVYARGSPHDLKVTAEAAKDYTWDYNCMIPYFQKSEKLQDKEVLNSLYGLYYGKNGTIGMARQPHDINKKYLKAFAELNKKVVLDTNGPDTIGFAEPMFMISGGIRQSTALTSLVTAAGRANLDVMLNTKATKILINDNNTAIGVEAKRKNGNIITIKAKREVIVCAGAFKTAQLLMLSGIGIRKLLEFLGIPVKADLPVGKDYQDHAGVYLNIKLNITTDNTPANYSNEFPSPTIIGYDTLNKTQTYPDFRNRIFIFPSDSKLMPKQCRYAYSLKNKTCYSLNDQVKGHEVMSIKIGQLHALSRGQITLQSSDPDDDPQIIPGFFSNKKDINDTIDYIKQILKVKDTESLKKYNASVVYPDIPECDIYKQGTEDYWYCAIPKLLTPMYDTTSSCSIGSVVDNRARVFNITGLRVADASILPYSPSGGPQAQVMALAYKVADMVKADNKDKNKEENKKENKDDDVNNKSKDESKLLEANILGLQLSLF